MSDYEFSEIFLVDDDSIVRLVSSKILKSIGFENPVSLFENGQKVLSEITKRKTDQWDEMGPAPILLFLDIHMPVMDAWAFLEEFALLDQKIKDRYFLAIITSSIDVNDQRRAFSFPCVKDYINKPLSGKQVLEFLSKHGLYEE
jgi:CheY-like chemotaxis protein